jgi:Kef-type K+ transport system membrane component KefB
MAGGEFGIFLELVAFMCSAWMGGRLFKFFNFSPIIGEIVAGVILGPESLNLYPYSHERFAHAPNPFVFCGNVRI